jgi:hypothetical protein
MWREKLITNCVGKFLGNQRKEMGSGQWKFSEKYYSPIGEKKTHRQSK